MSKHNSKIRRLFAWSLVFCFSFTGCYHSKDESIRIFWENERPRGILIPVSLVESSNENSFDMDIAVTIEGRANNPHILGYYSVEGQDVIFKPLLPLTHGLRYSVHYRNKFLGTIQVPNPDPSKAPFIVTVYPGEDTVPENLLKLYIQFSSPMQEGGWKEKITLLKNGTDTVRDAFLDEDLELWNRDRTILTIWFDPGRLKRGLQPNEKLGSPLQSAQRYEVIVSEKWRDINGTNLTQDFHKKFYTIGRDSLSPNINTWVIQTPKAGTSDSLMVEFGEAMDAMLLLNSVWLVYKGNPVFANVTRGEKERKLFFVPRAPWVAGEYQLVANAKFEDLAGNNLNRLFDNPVDIAGKALNEPVYMKSFRIK